MFSSGTSSHDKTLIAAKIAVHILSTNKSNEVFIGLLEINLELFVPLFSFFLSDASFNQGSYGTSSSSAAIKGDFLSQETILSGNSGLEM